jgi:hypothetical protein
MASHSSRSVARLVLLQLITLLACRTGDGKLYLRADRLFECAVTLGIVDPRKQWVMSDLRFLYVAKQDLKGKNGESSVGQVRRNCHPLLTSAL